MDPLAKLKARRLGSGSHPRSAPTSAAVAHRRHDAYLQAFGGTPTSTEAVANVPLPFPLSATTLLNHEQLRPAPRPGQACPGEAARLPLSADGRNLLCGSVDWGRLEACFGSADHAAYALDLRQRRTRTLFTKTAGHREWVAAVAHLPDGRIASGGLDARVIVWSVGGAACQELTGHAGPVSQLAAVPAAGGAAFVSASYDKRLMTWRASAAAGRVQRQQVLLGHGAPILQLCVRGSHAASGDRQGGLRLWDLAAGAAAGTLAGAHTGHCTALQWWVPGQQDDGSSRPPLLLSGGQDGCVCVWDLRTGRAVAQCAAHAGAGGTGAVSAIAVAVSGCIVTAGADCTAKGLDPRMMKAAWSRELPEFPYSMAVHADHAFVGCGDGSIAAGSCGGGGAWHGLSAGSCAVRTLHASHELLVAGCDDGSAVLLPRAVCSV